MAKQKNRDKEYQPKWMRDKDLTSVIIKLGIGLFALCIVILYILAKVDPEGYVVVFYPVTYFLDLYHKASPGEKLGVLSLLIGGVIGWFLNRWFSKKK